MSKNNAITVNTYNDEFQTYIDTVADEVTGSIKTFIDDFLRFTHKGDHVLEVGSGTGRDAAYIEAQGYTVFRTDAAQNFVDYMARAGHQAKQLDIINETLDQTFDAALANGVFLHFDDEDFAKAMGNIRTMLKPGGVFALSLHKGAFRGISDYKHSARYFREWTKQELDPLITELGFTQLSATGGISVSGRQKEWIRLVLRKA
jgi:SAM-dependent methyltransferase